MEKLSFLKDLIKYSEKDGRVLFSYSESFWFRRGSCKMFELKGTVPKKVADKGIEAIREYVEKKVEKNIGEQKIKFEARRKYEENPEFLLSTKYKGQELRGRIVRADSRYMLVRLESPLVGEKFINYGMASAMGGYFVFDKDGKFTENAVDSAQGLLVDIYKEEKHKQDHKETIDLVDDLNKRK